MGDDWIRLVPKATGAVMSKRSERDDSVRKVFSLQLQYARERAGYKSAQQFAHKLGIEPATYRFYERGQSSPDLETIVLICQELGCTPNFLLPAASEPRRPRQDPDEA